MSPANKSVIVSLSCFLCEDSGSGAWISGWFSAGSFMILEVVPQAVRSTVKRRVKIKMMDFRFLITLSPGALRGRSPRREGSPQRSAGEGETSPSFIKVLPDLFSYKSLVAVCTYRNDSNFCACEVFDELYIFAGSLWKLLVRSTLCDVCLPSFKFLKNRLCSVEFWN